MGTRTCRDTSRRILSAPLASTEAVIAAASLPERRRTLAVAGGRAGYFEDRSGLPDSYLDRPGSGGKGAIELLAQLGLSAGKQDRNMACR
mgnify:CR=1 FL=1